MNGDMPIWVSYLVNGMSVATFVAVMLIFAKIMRWSGIVDTRLDKVEGWQRSHMEEQHL